MWLSIRGCSADPSTFSLAVYTGEASVRMWGPHGWEDKVPVHQFAVQFLDSQGVTANCALTVGSLEECAEYVQVFSRALGRVPVFGRAATRGLDLRPGKGRVPKLKSVIVWYKHWKGRRCWEVEHSMREGSM